VSDQDGKVDCQPIVYARCGANAVLDAHGGCAGGTDCSAQCGSSGGSLASSTGVCQCNDIQVTTTTMATTVATIKLCCTTSWYHTVRAITVDVATFSTFFICGYYDAPSWLLL
jgi:hypothetical protein